MKKTIKIFLKKLYFRVKYSKNKPLFIKAKPSFSQCGEDLIVDYIFGLRHIQHPTYLDIGAHDPNYLNNTAIFYQRGCRGVNIEANPALIQNFIDARPEDTNINIGISDLEGELDFYIMKDDTLSTFSKKEYQFMVENGKDLFRIKKINLTTIQAILEKYCQGIFPDFLTVDVEGMDFQIIQSIDFSRSSPKVICIEAADYSPIGAGERRNEIIEFLVGNGYFEYANTNLNAIMVKR